MQMCEPTYLEEFRDDQRSFYGCDAPSGEEKDVRKPIFALGLRCEMHIGHGRSHQSVVWFRSQHLCGQTTLVAAVSIALADRLSSREKPQCPPTKTESLI